MHGLAFLAAGASPRLHWPPVELLQPRLPPSLLLCSFPVSCILPFKFLFIPLLAGLLPSVSTVPCMRACSVCCPAEPMSLESSSSADPEAAAEGEEGQDGEDGVVEGEAAEEAEVDPYAFWSRVGAALLEVSAFLGGLIPLSKHGFAPYCIDL